MRSLAKVEFLLPTPTRDGWIVEERLCAFRPQIGDLVEATLQDGTVTTRRIEQIVWDLDPEEAPDDTAKLTCYLEEEERNKELVVALMP